MDLEGLTGQRCRGWPDSDSAGTWVEKEGTEVKEGKVHENS